MLRLFSALVPAAAAALALASSCTPFEAPVPAPPELAQASQALGSNGVPVNGYPSYFERETLVAINRARSDPDNPALGTAGLNCGGSPARAKSATW